MKPVLGVIGGTGINYKEIFSQVKEFSIKNKYGKSYLKSVNYKGKEVIFLERHGQGHKLAPHEVNYRANIYAFKELGVERILSTAAVGAIDPSYEVGSFILIDDFIDFTKTRKSTFFEDTENGILHVDMSEPYCPQIRHHILNTAKSLGIKMMDKGTYVCTEGPRFETRAEIKGFSLMGAHVVGMTNVPEVTLAREQGLCYATIAMVTNYAAGVSKYPLTHREVIDSINQMSDNLKKLILSVIDTLPIARGCNCYNARAEQGSLK